MVPLGADGKLYFTAHSNVPMPGCFKTLDELQQLQCYIWRVLCTQLFYTRIASRGCLDSLLYLLLLNRGAHAHDQYFKLTSFCVRRGLVKLMPVESVTILALIFTQRRRKQDLAVLSPVPPPIQESTKSREHTQYKIRVHMSHEVQNLAISHLHNF